MQVIEYQSIIFTSVWAIPLMVCLLYGPRAVRECSNGSKISKVMNYLSLFFQLAIFGITFAMLAVGLENRQTDVARVIMYQLITL